MKKGLFMIMAMVAFTVASCGTQKTEEVVVEDSTTVVEESPAPVEDVVEVDTDTVEEVVAQ
jgi:uncharacterized protein YcfL